METSPLSPSLAMTALVATIPGAGFRLDVAGRADPAGNTVRNVLAVWSTAVTFRTTASTPVAGTPPRPVTLTFTVCPGPTWPPAVARPSMVAEPGRVSRSRAGTRAVYPVPPRGAARGWLLR